jgi:hypothetical protein
MIYIAGAGEFTSNKTDLQSKFQAIGFNTGNMAIARGVKDIIEKYFQTESIRYDSSSKINENDILVIGAANWISKTIDLDWLFAPGIERFERILIFGLGVQNEVEDLDNLSSSCQKLLRWLIEKNAVICTRDQVTKTLLDRYYERVFWTGCPSLRIIVKSLSKNIRSGISYGGSVEVLGHANNVNDLTALEEKVISELCNHTNFTSYILQAELPLMSAIDTKDYKLFHDYLNAELKININDSLINKFKFYFDLDEWISQLSEREIFFGTRLHGNILAWLSGTPAFLIAHDTRTKSFIDDFKFPGVYLKPKIVLDDLINEVKCSDYSNFNGMIELSKENLSNAIKLF